MSHAQTKNQPHGGVLARNRGAGSLFVYGESRTAPNFEEIRDLKHGSISPHGGVLARNRGALSFSEYGEAATVKNHEVILNLPAWLHERRKPDSPEF